MHGKAIPQTLNILQAILRKWPELWWLLLPVHRTSCVIISLTHSMGWGHSRKLMACENLVLWRAFKNNLFEKRYAGKRHQQWIVEYLGASKGRLTYPLNWNKGCICQNLETYICRERGGLTGTENFGQEIQTAHSNRELMR